MKRVAIIGSTGSVGRSTLDVIESLHERFTIVGLAVHSAVDELADQVARFRPIAVSITDPRAAARFKAEGGGGCRVFEGPAGLIDIARMPEADIVVSAAVGAAGLAPTFAAIDAGKTVALANKESMVVGGELLQRTAARSGATILPVDSEHNAIFQCLRAGEPREVRRLILTASGGPFRQTPPAEFSTITPEAALRHPVWKMGQRITIDSATLMNKGLEVIEAHWMFGIPAGAIEIVVHPQSVVHSMVEFIDGSIVAQLGTADMRQPIQFALTYPERLSTGLPRLDWSAMRSLEFEAPDPERFPCFNFAYRALTMGGTAPAVLNAADEVAVSAFLDRHIGFSDIPRVIASTLEAHAPRAADSIESILSADRWARQYATEVIN